MLKQLLPIFILQDSNSIFIMYDSCIGMEESCVLIT
jgi:hypothetical protein